MSGYLFITVISSCLFTSYHNKKCLRAQLPLAMITALISIGGINNWLYHASVYKSGERSIYIIKGLYITSFTFAIACVITPFFI